MSDETEARGDENPEDEYTGRNEARDRFIHAFLRRQEAETDFLRLADVLALHNRVGTDTDYNFAKTLDRAADNYAEAQVTEHRRLNELLLLKLEKEEDNAETE